MPEGIPVTELRWMRHVSRIPVSLDATCIDQTIGERLACEDPAMRDIFGIIENVSRSAWAALAPACGIAGLTRET